MRVSKSTFVPGRFFLIPLKLSGFGIGQITEIHESVLSAYACLVFSKKLSSRNERFSVDDLTNRKITHQFVTPDLLWNGRWEALSIEPLLVTQDELISKAYEDKGSYVGATAFGSEIIAEFLYAWHGQLPWNMMFDPEYFDKLLLDGVVKPNSVVYENK